MGVATAILGSAAIGAATSIIGASKQASAAKDAAQVQAQSADAAAAAQLQAAQESNELQREIYYRSRADQRPWRETGADSLAALAFERGVGDRPEGYNGFTATPGYQFRLAEGQRAIDNSAAARGSALSGATIKAHQRFGQGLAASEHDKHTSGLAALAGVGQTATNQLAALGQNYANAVGANNQFAGNAQANALNTAGQARASAYNQAGQAWNSGLAGVGQAAGFGLGAYQQNQLLSALRGPQTMPFAFGIG